MKKKCLKRERTKERDDEKLVTIEGKQKWKKKKAIEKR